MNESKFEKQLCAMLDALALGAKLKKAARAAIKRSEAGDPFYGVSWRGEAERQFCELVPIAQNMGRVAREQRLRGVTVNGEVQYVLDPALLARFGSDDDAKDMAELAGFPDFPFAHDIDGDRIPLLSARHPRPQRKHRPNSPPCPSVGEQSSDANSAVKLGAAGMPQREWRPDDPEPPYSRNVYCAAEPPRVFVPTPATPHLSPLKADLLQRLASIREHGPANARPIDRNGRATMPARITGQRADDPPEKIGA